jgi:hypothetical protein
MEKQEETTEQADRAEITEQTENLFQRIFRLYFIQIRPTAWAEFG